MNEGAETTGINAPNVTAWFTEAIPGVEPPLTFELVAGGHSNLTFKVTDAAGEPYVLRRPPLFQVLATAHDMTREYKVISALGPTPVPVPHAYGLCTDDAVNDRPFYVMGFVDGLVLRTAAEAGRVPEAVRMRSARALVEVLAALHAVDVDAVGLGDLGRKEDYVARQLRRWLRQFNESKTQERPEIVEVHDHLVARIPPQGEAGIVHGDYRLDNCIIDHDGEILAVLDWELCTLGDRLADVAQLASYWSEPTDRELALDNPPTLAGGFPSRAELLEWYGEASGRDLSDMDFYLAFAYWRLACILEGVYSRYAHGAMGDKVPAGGVDQFRRRIDGLVASAADAAARVP